jgi:glycosyltransferase involved in cell wall biosynthesis
MKFLFFLPEIAHLATGGNVYNRLLSENIPNPHKVQYEYIQRDSSVDHSFECIRNVKAEENPVLLIDSLLMKNAAFLHSLQGIPATYRKILIVHHLEILDPKHNQSKQAEIEMHFLSLFDGFIVTSCYSFNVLKQAGIARRKILLIPPGTNPVNMPQRSEITGPLKLLTVSSIFPGKGLLELIDILTTVLDLDWQWQLVGEDRLDEIFTTRFVQKLEMSEIRDRIIIHKPVDHEQIFRFYSTGDIFVLPSQFESCSMVTMEALRAGLPVVCYNVGGLSELIRNGENGYLLASGDSTGFAHGIRKLIMNSSLRERMKKSARFKARTFSGWDYTAENFVSEMNKYLKFMNLQHHSNL